jgi:hypothetical protein
VLQDINVVEQYKIVKDNLYKRMGNILKNSSDFEKNPEIWSYVIASMFPELHGYIADLKHKQASQDTYYDTVLNALLGI